MSPTRDGNTMLQCFKHGNAIEIGNGTMFDLYLGLPHILKPQPSGVALSD